MEIGPGVFDWSTVHAPSSDVLCGAQPKGSEWNQFKLSQEQVQQFWRDGFLLNVPILTTEQCDMILDDYKYFLDADNRHPGHDMLYEYHGNQSCDPDNVLMHCLGQWRLTSLFHDLVFHPKIVVPCSQLVNKEKETSVRFWHDQLFAKPARHGGVVAWHQDYSYWTRTKPCQHVTVHLALDEQTAENGGLMYIPGSHRWTRNGEPLPVLDFNFKDMEGIKSILTDEERASFKPLPASLKKGEVSFHAGLAIHGSYGNRSDKPRRAAVLNYFADGVISDSDGNMLIPADSSSGTSSLFAGSKIPKGEKMMGQFYPLVYDPSWAKTP